MNLKEKNSRFYNSVWRLGSLQDPKLRSTWDLVKKYQSKKCLEIGPGNTPIIPFQKGYFLDISQSAVKNLKSAGLKTYLGEATRIPFDNNFFDLVVAWHILEHVDDDQKAFSEISRVLKKGGGFLLAVPIWQDKFNQFDRVVGHRRRYPPEDLVRSLKKRGFIIHSYHFSGAAFGGKYFASLKAKVYQYFGKEERQIIPRSLFNLLLRISLLIEKKTTRWQTGEPESFPQVDFIALLCQKTE